jgi:Tetratricopeptide repeat
VVARQDGEYAAARALLEESLPPFRAHDDVGMIAWVRNELGLVAAGQGQDDEARALCRESLAAWRAQRDQPGIAQALLALGLTAVDRGDHAAAAPVLHECAVLCRELGYRWLMPALFEGLAGRAAGRGQPERALRLAGAAGALREALGLFAPRADQARLERWLEPARHQLGPTAAAAAWAEGQAMTPEQAVADALADAPAAA